MLDVHPPHHPTHTWRDFFIHIATICVGLLIAIGLEQSVEAIHHHEQVEHAREALMVERDKNLKLYALEARVLEHYTAMYTTNLDVLHYLREHPGATPSTWPGSIHWGTSEVPFVTAAWNTVQRDGVIEHLPQAEVEKFDDIYRRLDQVRAVELVERAAVERAGHLYAATGNLQQSSPADLTQLIDATNDVLVAHARIGWEMRRMNTQLPDFGPGPAEAPLRQLLGMDSTPDPVADGLRREFIVISRH
jgi:hypothetical protein